MYDQVLHLRIYAGTRALLDAHRAAGVPVWFVTASPREIAELLARRLGATGALCTVADEVDGFYTGRLVGDLLHGEAKARAVRELAERAHLDLARSFAYGDSTNDLPLLSSVGFPCAINPDRRLRRSAAELGWPVRDFRPARRTARRGAGAATLAGGVWALTVTARAARRAFLARAGRGTVECCLALAPSELRRRAVRRDPASTRERHADGTRERHAPNVTRERPDPTSARATRHGSRIVRLGCQRPDSGRSPGASRRGWSAVTVLVRLARHDDAPAPAELAAVTFPLACPPDSTPEDQRAFVDTVLSQSAFESYLADGRRTILVAQDEQDARLDGYVMLVAGMPADPDVRTTLSLWPTVELSKCYVRPQRHGAGVADLLLEAGLENARVRRAVGCWLGVNQLNERAQRFYHRHGFRRVGTKHFRRGTGIEDDYVLERVL